MKSTKNFVGILAALILVAGGLYGIQSINAGENCGSHAASKATAEKTTKVEAASATATSAGCCPSKTANAVAASGTAAGAQCTYNAKTASAQCTPGSAVTAELLTAEACMAKLSHCGIDVRTADANALAAKLVNGKCGSFTQEQWASMIKSAQALDAKQADAIFASSTSEKKECTGCPYQKVAVEMAAAQAEEKKTSVN